MMGHIKYKTAELRFYEELNDFLPLEKRKVAFIHSFNGKPAIKDVIESYDVPHTEVDLILINGNSVGFGHHLQDGDRVSVYPVFEALDISDVIRLRKKPLRKPKFILDVHLGRLAKYMRLFGFDTLYRNNYDDAEIVRTAQKEQRIVLTRDRGLLKIKTVTHGYWLRSTKPKEQIIEVISKFDLSSLIKPFQRCLICNCEISQVKKELIITRLQPKTRDYYSDFYSCKGCKKIYWEGSHYHKMDNFVTGVINKLRHSAERMVHGVQQI